MKRFTAILLTLIMAFSLCACGANTDHNTDTDKFTAPTEVTTPDGQPVYSAEPFIEYPQTGEYKETALLTNVPGQGVPLLLDMREDGTIDYIFASTSDYLLSDNEAGIPTLSFKENGVKYYTIAPDGTATLHKEDWIGQIDNYMDITNTTANLKNGKWSFRFAAEEGTILILAQFGPNLYTLNKILHTVLFQVRDGQVTIVPIDYHVELDGQPIDWSTAFINDMRLENGHILFLSGSALVSVLPEGVEFEYTYAAYQINGSLSDVTVHSEIREYLNPNSSGYTRTVVSINPEGMICFDEVYWPATGYHYTDNDSLYNLGTYASPIMNTFTLPREDFCCWFDEVGQGVLIRYDYNPEGAIEPEVVTVWSLKQIDLINTAVTQWNRTHSSPIFRYETGEAELESSNLTEEDILTRLNLELLNNQGPDVMILDGLNVEKYLDFMVPLNKLDTTGVYESILDRFTVNGDLTALPARTVPYLLGRLAEGTQQINSLEAFADMVTSSSDVLDVRYTDDWTPHGLSQYYIKNYNQLFRLWYPAWADAMWKDGKLNKEVFTEFITQTTRLVDHYTLTEPKEEVVVGKPTNPERLDTAFDPILTETDFFYLFKQLPYTLVAPGYVGIDTYWYLNQGVKYNSDTLYPHYIESIPGPDSTGVMVPAVIASVRAGGHEEVGLKFVQSLLSRELQLGMNYWRTYDGDGYPVIWKYVETLIERKEHYLQQDCMVENDYKATITNLRTVIIDEYLFEQTLLAAQSCYRTENRLSPEEAAEALIDATRIYLAELR